MIIIVRKKYVDFLKMLFFLVYLFISLIDLFFKNLKNEEFFKIIFYLRSDKLEKIV